MIRSLFFSNSTSPRTARVPSGHSSLYYISQWQLITPSNGQKHFKTAENDQFSKTLAGYKWSQKVAIFSEVKEKG